MALIAIIALNAYFLWKGMSPIEPFRSDERKLYVGAGVFSSITMGLFYLSLDISRVVVMMPFRSLSPLFVVIISYVFLQRLEKVTRLLVVGSILVVGGTALVGMNL
ncbi:MAG: EamA family transporter [Archaeoglobaceae archaeon]